MPASRVIIVEIPLLTYNLSTNLETKIFRIPMNRVSNKKLYRKVLANN